MPTEGPKSQIRWLSLGSLLLGVVLLLYVVLSVTRSGLKPLWFDELGTLNVASQPTLAQMFRVEPGDGNPPLQYLLVRPCLQLFGATALALRLPALLFVGLAIVCVYIFVARRFGAAAGLLCSVLLMLSTTGDFGVEARPYGLLLGLTALLLVLWQQAAMTRRGREPLLLGMTITVFALVMTHPMGIFWAGIPLLAGEACRWWRARRLGLPERVDKPMLLAIALGFSAFAIALHFGRETQQALVSQAGARHPAISLPTLARLREALRDDGLVPALALLLPMSVLALWTRRHGDARENGTSGSGAPLHEWVAAAALALTILVAFLFTRVVTHYFWGRYLIPGILGWFLLLGMVCGTVGKRWLTATVLCVCLLLVFQERRVIAKEQKPWPQDASVSPLLVRSDPSEPIVIASPVLFDQVWWYSSPALRPRIHYIADAQQAVATDDFVGDLTLISMHAAGSAMFPPDTLTGFLASNRRFLLWQGYLDNGDWVQGYLRSRGYEFTAVGKDAAGEVLWQVRVPFPPG